MVFFHCCCRGCSYFSIPTYGNRPYKQRDYLYCRFKTGFFCQRNKSRRVKILTLQNTATNNANSCGRLHVDCLSLYQYRQIATRPSSYSLQEKIPESITGNYSSKTFHCARNSTSARFKYPYSFICPSGIVSSEMVIPFLFQLQWWDNP